MECVHIMATKNIGIRVNEDNVPEFDKVKSSFDTSAKFAEWIIDRYRKEKEMENVDLFRSELINVNNQLDALYKTMERISVVAIDTCNNKDLYVKHKIEGNQAELQDLSRELQELEEKNIRLVRENETLLAEFDASTKETNALYENNLKALEQEIEELKSALKKAEESAQTSQAYLKELQAKDQRYNLIQEENKRLAQISMKYDKLIVTNRANEHKLQKALDALKQEQEETDTKISQAIKETKIEASQQLQEQIAELTVTYQAKLDAMEDRLNQKDNTIADLQKKILAFMKTSENPK